MNNNKFTSQQNGFVGLTVLIILLCIAIVGAAGYVVYQKQNKTNEVVNVQSENKTINEIVEEISGKVAESVPDVKEAGIKDGNYNNYIHYQPEGYNYYTVIESSISVNYAPVSPTSPETEVQEDEARRLDRETLSSPKIIITDALESNGFNVKTDYLIEEMIGEGTFYERDSDVCAVSTSRLFVGVVCASKDEFVSTAIEVSPFVEAYLSSGNEITNGISFGLVETGTGTTENDVYANVSIGVAGAYFYEQNDQWIYFAASSEGLECSLTEGNQQAKDAFSKICRQSGEPI